MTLGVHLSLPLLGGGVGGVAGGGVMAYGRCTNLTGNKLLRTVHLNSNLFGHRCT